MRSTAKGDLGLVFYLFVRAFTWFEPASFVFLLARRELAWLQVWPSRSLVSGGGVVVSTGAVFLVLSEVQF